MCLLTIEVVRNGQVLEIEPGCRMPPVILLIDCG